MSDSEDSDQEFEKASAGGGAYSTPSGNHEFPSFSDSPEFLERLRDATSGDEILFLLDNLVNTGDPKGRNLTFTRLLKSMKNKEYKLLPAQLLEKKKYLSQYNKDEQQLFRSSVSTVHATEFFFF